MHSSLLYREQKIIFWCCNIEYLQFINKLYLFDSHFSIATKIIFLGVDKLNIYILLTNSDFKFGLPLFYSYENYFFAQKFLSFFNLILLLPSTSLLAMKFSILSLFLQILTKCLHFNTTLFLPGNLRLKRICNRYCVSYTRNSSRNSRNSRNTRKVRLTVKYFGLNHNFNLGFHFSNGN